MHLKIIALPTIKTATELLLAHLATIHPKETIIFSDMDSTLIFQTDDGFEASQKAAIANYLDQGGTLVVVTGDSKPVSEDTFIKRLNYTGSAPIYFITGSGFQVTKYQTNQEIALFTGKEISVELRKKILERLESLFKDYFKSKVNLSHKIHRFLSNNGFITKINEPEYGILLHNKPLLARFRLEVRPNKITLAFDGRDAASLQEYALYRQPLLDLISTDPIITKLVQSDNLHMVSGGHYLDIIRNRKEDGIATFLAHPESKTLGIDQKHIIAMGDSENDKGLLCFPYQTNQSISRIFVGNKDSLFQAFQKNSIEKEFLYLKNMLTKGSELIFRSLKSTVAPSP